MGQYYKAYLKNYDESGNEQARVFSPMDYNYGYKLLEHAWINNRFVDSVMAAITEKPTAVAWIGDYANEDEDFEEKPSTYNLQDYERAWHGEIGDDDELEFVNSSILNGYLLNCDQCQYIDLKAWMALNGVEIELYNGEVIEQCLHPLPILTAIGNGRGGGDYCSHNAEHVGDWAMNNIMFTTSEPPADYKELDFSTIYFDSAA